MWSSGNMVSENENSTDLCGGSVLSKFRVKKKNHTHKATTKKKYAELIDL